MRTLRLAGMAARAEQLRLRRLARRLARQAALLAVAGLFLALAVLALHIAAFAALTRHLPTDQAALCLAGADLLLSLLVFWLALRGRHASAMERDARALRDEALAPIVQTFSLSRLAFTVASLLRGRREPPT